MLVGGAAGEAGDRGGDPVAGLAVAGQPGGEGLLDGDGDLADQAGRAGAGVTAGAQRGDGDGVAVVVGDDQPPGAGRVGGRGDGQVTGLAGGDGADPGQFAGLGAEAGQGAPGHGQPDPARVLRDQPARHPVAPGFVPPRLTRDQRPPELAPSRELHGPAACRQGPAG